MEFLLKRVILSRQSEPQIKLIFIVQTAIVQIIQLIDMIKSR